MIPHGLTNEDILFAVAQIDREGFPAVNKSRRYYLLVNDKEYPPKHVIRLAAIHAGLQLTDYNAVEAKSYFQSRGYEIIERTGYTYQSSEQVHDEEEDDKKLKIKYWWVNHKQTFSAEIEGGYIWSPKSNVNGGFNQTYLNLTQVKPGDVVFSYASGMIKAIGVATNSYREQLLPAAFGGATERWGEIGWEVLIQWKLLQVPISPKDHLQKFASLLPEKHSPIRADGNGNQGCYLASISDELGLLLMDMLRVGDTGAVYAAIAISEERQDQEAESIINQSDIAHTEKEQLIKARIGQGMFRINLEKIEKGCRVTGVTRKDLLIASHIKPWRDSDNAERIDGFNGLLLAPHVDKLFDRGWISFSDDGEILAVDAEIREILKSWGINPAKNIGRFSARQYSYLAYHRKNVFMRPDTSI